MTKQINIFLIWSITILMLLPALHSIQASQVTKAKEKISSIPNADSDGDGLTGRQEKKYGTDENDNDTDDDGFNDGYEINTNKTDPTDSDSDDDGLDDYEEIKNSVDPNNDDTDNDGLSDGKEVNKHGTKPNDADSDNDEAEDGDEIDWGTDPNNDDDPGDCYDSDRDSDDGKDNYGKDIYERAILVVPSESSGYEVFEERCTIKKGSTCLNSLTHTWETCACYKSSQNDSKEECGAEAVAEYYCSGGEGYYRNYNCLSGYTCSNGACVK